MLRHDRSAWLPALSLAVVASITSVHAYSARSEDRRAEAQLPRMGDLLVELSRAAQPGLGPRRVVVNGAPVVVETSTEPRALDAVVADVDRACAAGGPETVLLEAAGGGGEATLRSNARRVRVASASSADGEATGLLCVLEPDGDTMGGDDAQRRKPIVRYAFARRVDARTTSLTRVTTAMGGDLSALFPAEGDAPGSDLAGVPRPSEARRALTAVVGNDEHSVRIYESHLALAESVRRYDASMLALGYGATSAHDDARLYLRPTDGASVVASFASTDLGTTVAIAPFRPPRAPSEARSVRGPAS